ncbi:MAG TPA: hypothetical protein QGF02_03115 [Candidatus Babeliales bacterium]|nr:hypothetical protein [Candidatus Babeliales bacterium]
MSFLKRVGEGISISVVSMLFPFKHPALFLYPLACFAIAFPAASVVMNIVRNNAGSLPLDIVMFMMEVVTFVVVSIFFLGLVRGSIARMEGKTIKFWKAMAVDGRMLICLFFYVLIKAFLAFVVPSIETYFSPDFSLDMMDSMGGGLLAVYVAWCAATFYFLPVLAYETKNFFDAVGHSVKHFLSSFVEVICGVATSWALVGFFVGIGAFLLKVDRMDFFSRMQEAVRQPLAMVAAEGVAALFVVAVALILATGVMVLVPALYFYITRKRKNPFTSVIRKK